MRSQEEPGGARRSQEEPGVARSSQEEPGGHAAYRQVPIDQGAYRGTPSIKGHTGRISQGCLNQSCRILLLSIKIGARGSQEESGEAMRSQEEP